MAVASDKMQMTLKGKDYTLYGGRRIDKCLPPNPASKVESVSLKLNWKCLLSTLLLHWKDTTQGCMHLALLSGCLFLPLSLSFHGRPTRDEWELI